MIKVALLDNNDSYLKKLHDYWSRTYGSGSLLMYVFNSPEQLWEWLRKEKIDILLLNPLMEVDVEEINTKTFLVYLLPGKQNGEINGIPALAKNGNADLLYQNLMELYEEHLNIKRYDIPGQVVLFTSPQGGSGNSSAAVGFGKYLAGMGKKALYLNLEAFSAMEQMLDGFCEKCMDDLFYLCQSDRKNLSYTLENLAARDSSGLFYINQCRNPIEFQEKGVEDIKAVLTMVSEKRAYDVVIVDREFSMDEIAMELMRIAGRICLVTDSTEVGRRKLERGMALLEEWNRRNVPNGAKVRLLYNKSASVREYGQNVLGCIPLYPGFSGKEVTDQMGHLEIYQELYQSDTEENGRTR